MKCVCRNISRTIFPAVALAALTACGGGSFPTPTYSIGGTVSGIDAGQSIVLQDNGGGGLTVSANGAFTFATEIAGGGAYAVTVTAPQGTNCTVASGSGTAYAKVTSIAVACVSSPQATVGGTVTGLVGQGLALELSGSILLSPILEISSNANFVFPPIVGPTGRLIVNIKQQPHSPTQRCVARHESFGLNQNITDVSVVCGEFSYVSNAADNTISTFSVDATTGAIASASPPVTVGLSPYAIASTVYSRDFKYLYVVNNGSNDVSVFGVDYASGKLTAISGSPFAAGMKPQALALYSFANAGDYACSPPQCTHSYLYVANAGSDDVSVFGVDRGSGVPTPMSPASYPAGTGPSVLAIHPSRPFLYTANTGGSSDISAFLINYTGGLAPIAGSPFPSGGSVSSLAFGAGGKFLYAANASGGSVGIYGFGVDTTAGALTVLSSFPYPVPSCNYIVADQIGAYLYATTGTSVIGYSIEANTGALSPLPGFPIAVGDVQSVSIDPTNQFLYVANGSVGTVTGFVLNGATGELTPMLGSPFTVGKTADFVATF